MNKNNKETFLQGAAILGVAGVFVKILGALFRVPLVWIITSVGLGYYQTAYPIYVVLVGIATSGFPVAISKMVSERRVVGNYKGADKVFLARVQNINRIRTPRIGGNLFWRRVYRLREIA